MIRGSSMVLGVVCVASLMACGEDDGEGTLAVAISGEDAAKTGYPVDLGAEGRIEFADGWTMTIDQVLASVSDFTLATADGETHTVADDAVVADLHSGDPALWSFEGVPAKRWDRVGYSLVPPAMTARRVGTVSDADLTKMVSMGYALYLRGTARKTGVPDTTFEFGFPYTVVQSHCVNAQDETDGVVVRNGGTTNAQITIHLDHLFFDSLVADEPNLRFDAIAAKANPVNHVTLEDLTTQSLSDLRDRDGMPLMFGGAPVVYDPGSVPLAGPNLREFILEAATTVGHWNGEGHCEYTVGG